MKKVIFDVCAQLADRVREPPYTHQRVDDDYRMKGSVENRTVSDGSSSLLKSQIERAEIVAGSVLFAETQLDRCLEAFALSAV